MKLRILILLAFSTTFLPLKAKDKEVETRTATVKLNVSPNDLINIRAKNTDLVLETWSKNEVEVVATVRFDGKMTDKMSTFLENFQEYVEENVQLSGGELKIDTNLDEPNKIQLGSKKVGLIIGFSEDEFKLEYKVKAPKQNAFEIDNSYKDVALVGDFEKLKMTQYSGDLRAGNVEDLDLDLKYGSASFKEIGEADISLYEQELDVDIIRRLELNAKYSELEIEEIGNMKAASYESDYELENVESITGNFKYGEIAITGELGKAELEFYETDMEGSSAGSVKFIQSKYGNYSFDRIEHLQFEQSYEDETDIGTIGKFTSTESKYGNHVFGTLTGSVELNAYEDEIEIREVASSVKMIEIDGKYIDAALGAENIAFNLYTNIKYGKVDYDESEVAIKKYIKENDYLEIEANSKATSETPVNISVKGYEVDVKID